MTDRIEPGDVVRFAHLPQRTSLRFVVRAVDGDQAWLSLLTESNVVREQIVLIDGLVRDDL